MLDEIEFFQGSFDSNMLLYPKEKACDMPLHKINHLDIERMTDKKNPYCIKVQSGKIDIKIEKDYADELPIATCAGVNCTIPWLSDAERFSKNNPANYLKNNTATENYSVNQTTDKEIVETKNESFNPIDICKIINDTEDRRICTKAVEEQPKETYTDTDNPCNKIENVNSRQTCYFATKKQYQQLNNFGTQRDVSICDELFPNDPTQKNLCIRTINAEPS